MEQNSTAVPSYSAADTGNEKLEGQTTIDVEDLVNHW